MRYLFGIILLILTACGQKEEVVKPKEVLKVALANKPRSFDPQRNTDSSTLAVTKQIYNNLFSLDENGDVTSELVEKYSIGEDKSITLQLKKGILFHDGSEMKALDVKKSLERNLRIPVSKVLVESIERIDVLDDYSLKIIQKNSPFILLHNLAHSSTGVVKEIEENESGINLVGTGAYKIKDWKIAEKITLERFNNYFEGAPKVEEIVFQTIPESSNRLIALETKEIDIAYDISANDIKGIEKKPDLRVINRPSLGSDFLTINTERLKDKRVRQALDYAIDKDSIIKAVYEGYGVVPNSILSPNVFGYSKEGKRREYNSEKARELLKEAGAENLKLKLWIYDEPSRQQMAQIIQANLKEVGVEAEIIVAEVSTFLQYTGRGEHDVLIGLWYVSTGDADYGYYPLLHSSSRGPIGNRSFYSNVKVDNLLDGARATSNIDERKEQYREVQDIVFEEVPLLPIAYKNYVIGLQKNVEGFVFNPNGNHILKNITLK